MSILKWNRTVDLNRSADRVRKKRPPSYFAVAAWTSGFSFLLQCSGRVQFKSGVDLVELSIFYKSEKTSGQTIRPKKIKTVALCILSWLPSLLTIFVAFTVLWTSTPKMKSLC